jgi:hypothetical protein
MPPNLIAYLIAALTMIICVMGAIGLPAIAVVLIRYLKLKERELVLEFEYRQKAEHQQSATDERVQRLEDALASLDHDVRVRLGIGESPVSLPSRPELVARPGESDVSRAQPLDPSRAKAR